MMPWVIQAPEQYVLRMSPTGQQSLDNEAAPEASAPTLPVLPQRHAQRDVKAVITDFLA
jgi:hypothetical protein